MAVEVIGVNDRLYKEVSCRNCASKLRYVMADTMKKKVSCMGEISTTEYIICPKCNDEVSTRTDL